MCASRMVAVRTPLTWLLTLTAGVLRLPDMEERTLSEAWRARYMCMMRQLGQLRHDEKGLTGVAIGLIAVVAVVVVGVGATVVPGLLPKSGEQRYDQDRHDITRAVLVHTSGYHPRIARTGAQQRAVEALLNVYPTFAMKYLGSNEALEEADVGNEPITNLGSVQTNPTAGRERAATPSWEDVDGDGKRSPGNEPLYYEHASPEPTADHWNTTSVTVKDVDYVVDSRDWFINLDMLVDKGYLDELPESASPDNSATGKGSYSWYVDENFEVKSMLYTRPTADTDGFHALYP